MDIVLMGPSIHAIVYIFLCLIAGYLYQFAISICNWKSEH